MKHIALAPQLEHSLLNAIREGTIAPSMLSAEELSKEGKLTLKSINHLLKHGAKTPLKATAVRLVAMKIFGGGRGTMKKYLRTLEKAVVEDDAKVIIKTAHSKEALVNLINEASTQLCEGDFDGTRLSAFMGSEPATNGKLRSVADDLSDGFPEPPRGIPMSSLPTISKATHGFSGLWILGGEPGVGKSTLAWQIAIELSEKISVLYHDLDGTGLDYFLNNTLSIFEGNKKKVRQCMRQFYFREDLNKIDEDLAAMMAPMLIVVDSMQTVPVNISHRRNSLDKWLIEFKGIAKRGYPMLIVSEVPRGSYENVSMGGYKETGELEYAGSVCARMMGNIEDEDEPIQFHIIKNKHYKRHGHIIDLERTKGKDYWFGEVEA